MGGWGPTNTGKHWFEPRLIGGFILCCFSFSPSELGWWSYWMNRKIQSAEGQRGFAHSHAYIQIKSPPKIEDTWDILRPQSSPMTQVTQVMVVPCSKVLALPLFAVSWALFNVWRVAFRQAGCLRIQIKKTWRNGKKRMVLPCLSLQNVVLGVRICFYFLADQRCGFWHFTYGIQQWELVFVEGSLEVKLPTIWTDEKQSRAEAERRERSEERRSEKRKSQKKEDGDARKGRHAAIHCVFPMICGSGGSKSRLAKAAGAEPAGQRRDENLHAVVARSTFPSQNVKNTRGAAADHFWHLRCRKSARCCGAKHMSKWKCTKHTSFGPLLEVEMSKKCTPLWREAHFQVKMYKTHHVRTIFGGSHVVRFAWQAQGIVHLVKSEQNVRVL